MAEQVMIMTWCDVCQADHHRDVDATPYTVNGIRVDLCEDHGTLVAAALELFTQYGRKDKPKVAPEEGLKAPTARKERLACPECGKDYVGSQGLGAHRRSAHGVVGAYSRDAKVTQKDLDHIATGQIRTA